MLLLLMTHYDKSTHFVLADSKLLQRHADYVRHALNWNKSWPSTFPVFILDSALRHWCEIWNENWRCRCLWKWIVSVFKAEQQETCRTVVVQINFPFQTQGWWEFLPLAFSLSWMSIMFISISYHEMIWSPLYILLVFTSCPSSLRWVQAHRLCYILG